MGKYAHSCPEWDGHVIDDTDPEFAFCTCFPNDDDAQEAKQIQLEKIDEGLAELSVEKQLHEKDYMYGYTDTGEDDEEDWLPF